jgi:hypothetical protein
MGNAAATIIAAGVATGNAASRAVRGLKDATRKAATRSASRVTVKRGAAAENHVEIVRPARVNRSSAAIVAMAAVRRASRASPVSRVSHGNPAVRLVPRFAAKAAAMPMAKDAKIAAKDAQIAAKDAQIAAKDAEIAAKAGNSRIARRARHPGLASKASRKALSQ